MLLMVVFYSCSTDKNNNLSTNDTETLFTLLDAKETGIDFFNKVKNQKNFNISGEARNIQKLLINNEMFYVISINNDVPIFIKLHK